jgi:hypothetical protein
MPMNRLRRLATATVLASAAMLVAAQPASAQEEPIVLDPGVACQDFALRLENIAFPPTRKSTTINGTEVILLASGKSGAITYTNVETGESVAFRSRGTLLKETPTGDANVVIQEFSGNVGLVLFPTDEPAGPSTIQLNGRLVAEFNKVTGATTLLKLVGHQIDICAELA